VNIRIWLTQTWRLYVCTYTTYYIVRITFIFSNIDIGIKWKLKREKNIYIYNIKWLVFWWKPLKLYSIKLLAVSRDICYSSKYKSNTRIRLKILCSIIRTMFYFYLKKNYHSVPSLFIYINMIKNVNSIHIIATYDQ